MLQVASHVLTLMLQVASHVLTLMLQVASHVLTLMLQVGPWNEARVLCYGAPVCWPIQIQFEMHGLSV